MKTNSQIGQTLLQELQKGYHGGEEDEKKEPTKDSNGNNPTFRYSSCSKACLSRIGFVPAADVDHPTPKLNLLSVFAKPIETQ